VTTDLSQHYLPNDVSLNDSQPRKELDDSKQDFPAAKSGYSTVYWVAAGAGVLIASGLAAFTSFKQPQEPPASLAHVVPALSTDSESVAQAAFGDEEEEAEPPASREPNKPAQAVPPTGVEQPGSAAEAATAAAEAGDPPAVDALASVEAGSYYVQLASYRTKETADAHAKALAGRGFSAQSIAYGGPAAGWWHAVRLGPFDSRVAAEKSRFDLEAADRRAAYVLPRSNGKFHVQVASFSEREEAEQVAKSFSADGHATKVTRVKMSGSYWHCVRIGPFDTREEAVAYKALVPDVPGSQSTVIPFPPPPAR